MSDPIHIDSKQASAPRSQASAENAAPKMDPALKAKWVEALRSGAYWQCRNDLTDGERFCCIGVGYQVAGQSCSQMSQSVLDPTLRAAKAIGLTTEQVFELVDLNDKQLKSFPEIADHIEANL